MMIELPTALFSCESNQYRPASDVVTITAEEVDDQA
jgi:hypothetical protein